MCIDHLVSISFRQKEPVKILFIVEEVPVLGAIASVPGILMSLVLSVTKASQAAFNAVKAQLCELPADHNIRATQDKLMQDASDWGIILLNQMANLCTVGILNNILVCLSIKKLTNAYTDSAEHGNI